MKKINIIDLKLKVNLFTFYIFKKLVDDLRPVGGFIRGFRFSPTIKLVIQLKYY